MARRSPLLPNVEGRMTAFSTLETRGQLLGGEKSTSERESEKEKE